MILSVIFYLLCFSVIFPQYYFFIFHKNHYYSIFCWSNILCYTKKNNIFCETLIIELLGMGHDSKFLIFLSVILLCAVNVNSFFRNDLTTIFFTFLISSYSSLLFSGYSCNLSYTLNKVFLSANGCQLAISSPSSWSLLRLLVKLLWASSNSFLWRFFKMIFSTSDRSFRADLLLF